MKRIAFLFILFIALSLIPIEGEAQCAMCKAVVESAEEAGKLGGTTNIGEGLNKGIIFLMIVPYVLLFLLFRKKIGAFFKEMSEAQG